MRNNAKKKRIWYGSACLIIIFLLWSTQLTACTPGIVVQPSPTGTVSVSSGAHPNAQERQIAQAVFDAINRDRMAAKLSPLRWSDALARSGRQHNSVMAGANQLAHQLPGEAGLGDRERQQGITWRLAAENIGVTNDVSEHGALSLHQAMMAEQPPDDGHRQNILSPQSNQLGVDVLFDSLHGKLWLTEDFAEII